MKVSVNQDICTEHAQRNAMGIDVYDLDDHGYCVLTRSEVPAELHAQARIDADACPERAISIMEA